MTQLNDFLLCAMFFHRIQIGYGKLIDSRERSNRRQQTSTFFRSEWVKTEVLIFQSLVEVLLRSIFAWIYKPTSPVRCEWTRKKRRKWIDDCERHTTPPRWWLLPTRNVDDETQWRKNTQQWQKNIRNSTSIFISILIKFVHVKFPWAHRREFLIK